MSKKTVEKIRRLVSSGRIIPQSLENINKSSKKIQKSERSLKQSEEENRSGHWTEKQNLKYVMFIQFFEDKFNKKQNRRLWKIFKIMSTFIKTRTSNQCRSHHQKMQRHCKSIEKIILNFKQVFPSYNSVYQKVQKQLRKLNDLMSNSLIQSCNSLQYIPSEIEMQEKGDEYGEKSQNKIEFSRTSQSFIDDGERPVQRKLKQKKKLTIELMIEKQQEQNPDLQRPHSESKVDNNCFKKKKSYIEQKSGGVITLNSMHSGIIEEINPTVPTVSVNNHNNNNTEQFPPRLPVTGWPIIYYPQQYSYVNQSPWTPFSYGWPNPH